MTQTALADAPEPSAWADITGRVLAEASTRASSSFERQASLPKPSAAQMASISELALRYPAAREDGAQAQLARIRLLASDLVDIPAELLRAACRLAAQESEYLPTAALIRRHAKAEADRRAGVWHGAVPAGWRDHTMRAANLKLIDRRADWRWHGDWKSVTLGRHARCNGDGTVSVATWSDRHRDWTFDEVLP